MREVVAQLKKASKMHAQQAAKIEQMTLPSTCRQVKEVSALGKSKTWSSPSSEEKAWKKTLRIS